MRTKPLHIVLLLAPLLWLARDHAPPLLQPECADAACKTTTTTTSTTTTSTTTTTLAGALMKDLFERAALNPNPPVNWTKLGDLGAEAIYNSSDVTCASLPCTGGDVVDYYNATSISTTDSYVCILLKKGTETADVYFSACLTNGGGSGNEDAVCCTLNTGAGSTWSLTRWNNGTWGSVTSGSQAWSTGDSIAIVRTSQNGYSCYRDAAGDPVSWTLLGSSTYTVLGTSGIYAGMASWGSGSTTTEAVLTGIEAWEADDTTTLPTGATCGSN